YDRGLGCIEVLFVFGIGQKRKAAAGRLLDFGKLVHHHIRVSFNGTVYERCYLMCGKLHLQMYEFIKYIQIFRFWLSINSFGKETANFCTFLDNVSRFDRSDASAMSCMPPSFMRILMLLLLISYALFSIDCVHT